MEQPTNHKLIQSLIEAGYNAQIEEIPAIEGAVEILNDSVDEFGPIEQRNIIINWINDNQEEQKSKKQRIVEIGGSKKRQSKKRRYKTNKKRKYKKKRRQTVKR